MSQINGNLQPMHPVEHLAFWQTKPEEIRANAARYDALVQGDPILKKQLDDLLAWACGDAVSDEVFNNSGEDQ